MGFPGHVGSGVGLAIGLLTVKYINPIADVIGAIRGRPVFDPSIYYFYSIPTSTNPVMVTWVIRGSNEHRRAGQRSAGRTRRIVAPRGGIAV